MALADRLAGTRMLLTGATGFVGEALLERVLTDLPGTRVDLLVRAKPGVRGTDRVRQLLAKPPFASVRERTDVDTLLAERVTVLEGDLDRVPDLPGDLDLVVHCAGEVSFDPALDEGFATNVGGIERLLTAVHESGSTPHVVHVSTAYVSGLRKGHVPEGPLEHAIDWRAEHAAANRLRPAAEDRSRSAGLLARFRSEAQRSTGRTGPADVAIEAERRRRDWVATQLVDAGRERAASLGFTDGYTFTKAMGERAAEELAADLPLSILRPSIIESALARPWPGWIEGFKMAEPIILAYGRGELPEFPAVPDGIVDIVPVDLVVNAIIAVAAHPPEVGAPRHVHVGSGARNPLRFAELYENIRAYFLEHPLPARDRGTYGVPLWRFPGPRAVETRLRAAERGVGVADAVVTRLPASDRTRELVRRVDRTQAKLDFLRRYSDLYRTYAAAEVIFADDNLRAFEADLDPADRAAFSTDPAVVDWRHYLVEVHCPAVTSLLRAVGARPKPPAPTLTRELSGGTDVVAVFDMDGTLLPTNIVASYLQLRLADLPVAARARELAGAVRRAPRWLAQERRDRGALLRDVYQGYAGVDLEQLDRLVDDELASDLLAALSPAAVRRVRAHRAAGHRTVLVTGAVRALTRPLSPLFDEVVAADLEVRDGLATGHLAVPPLVGESRGAWLRRFALDHHHALEAAHAYGDSETDLPMLRAVGHPVAVNPDAALLRAAKQGKWPVESWPRHAVPVGVAR